MPVIEVATGGMRVTRGVEGEAYLRAVKTFKGRTRLQRRRVVD
jgi:hypothetical protein